MTKITVEDVLETFPGSKVLPDEPFDWVKHARQFLSALYGNFERKFPGQYFEVRLIFGNRAEQQFYSSPDEFLAHDLPQLLKIQEEDENFGLSFGVCPRLRKSGKSEDIKVIPALWVDLDGEGSTRIINYKPQPDIVAFSGGGYHAYWKLKTPTPANEMTSKILRAIQRAVGSDSVSDFARVMRLPGSLNLKDPQKPKRCKMTYISKELCHAV